MVELAIVGMAVLLFVVGCVIMYHAGIFLR
jgi:hypothetical protein